MNSNELFSQQNFHEAAQRRKEALVQEISGYDMATMLATPIEKLAKDFEERYAMNPPRLKSDEIYLLDSPKEVTTRERVRDRIWPDEYVNMNRSHIQFTVCVPFEGDVSLFSLRPSSYQYSLSRTVNATLNGNEVHISYHEPIDNGRQLDLNALYEGDVRMIETNLQHLSSDAQNFNRELPSLIQQKLNERRQNAEKNSNIIQSLKIPIKKRDDIPTTYAIPEIRRKPSIVESPKTKAFTPEPTLAVDEYEHILTIIKDMALAMERSPSTFAKLTEEEIRDFFLIHLNGHYQGNATGETFNGSGKTDILIRHRNANAFIAECKFWKGQRKMQEAIDQLLGYVTWRDTKTAILLFNKQPDLSVVLAKTNKAIKAHKDFKAEYQHDSSDLKSNETIVGYKFIHPTDPNKTVFLTLMAFQITAPRGMKISKNFIG